MNRRFSNNYKNATSRRNDVNKMNESADHCTANITLNKIFNKNVFHGKGLTSNSNISFVINNKNNKHKH